jgi:hypothetical protein
MKTYLGDGVYANENGEYVVLTTEDGITITNTVYIDEDVWRALKRFVATREERNQRQFEKGKA